MGWAVGVFKDSRSTNDSNRFPPNHEVGNASGSSSIEISWFVAFSRKRRLCKVLYKLALAFWQPVNQVGYSLKSSLFVLALSQSGRIL